MSSLQIGLAVAGGLVLAAMVGHSAWSTRRSRPRQAVTPAPEDLAELDREAGSGIEPELDAAAFELAHFPLAAPELKPVLDALIDVIAPIAVDAPLSGDAALVAMPATRRAGSKPFFIEGFSESRQCWETPVAGHRYSTFQAGVQLANRSGALNDIEYSEFVMKTQAFADAINGTPDFPEMREEVARARELDLFASENDAQLGFVLRARNAAWSPGYVQQNASRLGFVAGVIPGRMVVPASSPGLPAVLGLSFNTQAAMADDPALSAIREFSLSLDVPQVPREEHAFARLREAARILGKEMDGVITDGAGHALSEPDLNAIALDLEQLYDALDQRELSAGSPQARRLFS